MFSIISEPESLPQFCLHACRHAAGNDAPSELGGLTRKADWLAGSLPYGDQRRLEIARAMCTDPVLLCLDEPAAGLNARESAELNELLLAIRSEKAIGILLIEHDMSVVMGVCDSITVLNFGTVLAKGTPEEVQRDETVIEAYLGRSA